VVQKSDARGNAAGAERGSRKLLPAREREKGKIYL